MRVTLRDANLVSKTDAGAAGGVELSDPQASMADMADWPVARVMSRPALAVWTGTPLGDVLQVMLRTDHRHVVVIDGEGRCAGIIGDRAVAAAWAADPSALTQVRAGQMLDPQPATVRVHATVRDVANVMSSDQVDAVAVVDTAGRPIGVVTGGDLVALIARTCQPPLTAAPPILD